MMQMELSFFPRVAKTVPHFVLNIKFPTLSQNLPVIISFDGAIPTALLQVQSINRK